jgi:hypothetical protein
MRSVHHLRPPYLICVNPCPSRIYVETYSNSDMSGSINPEPITEWSTAVVNSLTYPGEAVSAKILRELNSFWALKIYHNRQSTGVATQTRTTIPGYTARVNTPLTCTNRKVVIVPCRVVVGVRAVFGGKHDTGISRVQHDTVPIMLEGTYHLRYTHRKGRHLTSKVDILLG